MIETRYLITADIDDLYSWRIDPDVQESSLDDDIPTKDEHVLWFNIRDVEASYMVQVNSNKIGTFSFKEEQPNRKLVWSFHLNPKYKGQSFDGKRYSMILCEEALRVGFEDKNANKIVGQVLSNNIKSVKLHKRLGFQQEGYFKQEVYKNERFIDLYQFAILKEDYNK